MKTRVIGIASGKGGVGKSFVSLNLAVELAVQQKKVLLIDADIGLGNIHLMLGQNPKHTLVDLMQGEVALDAALIKMLNDKLHILSGGNGLNKIFHISQNKKKNLFNELKKVNKQYDMIILDIGAGINKEVISFLELADEVLVVTNPDITAMADAYALLKTIYTSKKITKNSGLIVNKATVPVAKEVHNKLKTVSKKFLGMELRFIGSIEENRKAAILSLKQRKPLYHTMTKSTIRKQFYNLSLKVFSNIDTNSNGNGLVSKLKQFLGVEIDNA